MSEYGRYDLQCKISNRHLKPIPRYGFVTKIQDGGHRNVEFH